MRALVLTTLALLLSACYEIGGRRPTSDDDGADDDGADDDGADDDVADDDTGPSDDDSNPGDDDTGSGDDDGCTPEGATDCLGTVFRVCEGGAWLNTTCAAPTPFCDPVAGCLACEPNSEFCEGGDVHLCDGSGSGSTVQEDCADTESCLGSDCLSECDLAAAQFSYLGCEFLAVTTANIVSATFDNDFAVVIGAPASGPAANVTVSRGGTLITSQTVPSGQTAAITLPMVPEVKGATQSVVAPGAAYEVVSDTPVVAYQYNPLHFDLGGEASYTNDASMLLPEHALTGSYVGLTWPTWGYGTWTTVPFFGDEGAWDNWHPGWIAVAATEDGTQVTITASGLAARSAEGVLLGPPAPRRPDLDDLPTADHGLVDLRHYGESFVRGPTGALLSARGCPWDCAFCVRAYGRELALRSVPRLMEDIDHLARVGARSVRFMDDTFTAVRPRTLALCEALARRPRPLPWTCLTRLDRLDPEICLCMARAGCSRVYVGVESGDEGRRESFGKRLGDEALHVGVRAAKDAGLEVCGFFIVGSPGEGRRELQASTMLAAALGLDFVIVTRLQRWPGTRMAEASPSKEGGDDGFLAERTFYRRFYLRPSWVVRHAHLALRTPGDVWIGARELGRYTAGRVLGRDFI